MQKLDPPLLVASTDQLGPASEVQPLVERAAFEAWALPILGDNPTWKESGDCELAWQAWRFAHGLIRCDAVALREMLRSTQTAVCVANRTLVLDDMPGKIAVLLHRTAYLKA